MSNQRISAVSGVQKNCGMEALAAAAAATEEEARHKIAMAMAEENRRRMEVAAEEETRRTIAMADPGENMAVTDPEAARRAMASNGGDGAMIPSSPGVPARSPRMDHSPRVDQSPRVDHSPRVDNSPRADNSPRMDHSPRVDSIPRLNLRDDIFPLLKEHNLETIVINEGWMLIRRKSYIDLFIEDQPYNSVEVLLHSVTMVRRNCFFASKQNLNIFCAFFSK